MRTTAAIYRLFPIVLCLAAAHAAPRAVSSPQPPTSVCGHWVVKKILNTTNDQASPRSLKKYLGLEAEYLPSEMRFGNDVVPHPLYMVSRLSDVDFFKQNFIPLTQLGIGQKSVVVVEVKDHEGKDVVRPGTELFVRTQNEIITTWDGGYFELSRNGAPCPE